LTINYIEERGLKIISCLLITVLLIGTAGSLNTVPVNVLGGGSLLSVDWAHYHNYTELVDIVLQVNSTHPDTVDVFSIGKSYLGRDIYCVRLTNETHAGLKSRVLFVGYHHARERITAELLLRFIVDTVTVWGSNQTINAMLNDAEIFVIVALNVDGFEAVEENEWQRKNLQPYDEDGDGQFDEDLPDDADGDGYIEDLVRSTANGWEFVRWEGVDDDADGLLNEDWAGGVDLNRNYGYAWNASCDFPGSPDPFAEDYRGPEPFSENETQVMRDFALQNRFQYAVSFHSGGEWVSIPWMYTLEPTNDDRVFRETAGNISGLVGIPFPYSDVRSTISGVWDDWMYGNRSIIALTCEIYGNWSALSYTYAGQGLYWERGITQMFNPQPTGIETVLQRWLPVLIYVTNRAINDTLEFMLSDLNKDGAVDIFDVVIIAVSFGSEPADPNWNMIADINGDEIVDIFDLVVVAVNFGETI